MIFNLHLVADEGTIFYNEHSKDNFKYGAYIFRSIDAIAEVHNASLLYAVHEF